MTYLIYLFEASLILAGFYFFYRWLIRPLTFYGHKRILLLSIPVLALTMPLLEVDLGRQAPIQPISWMPVESPSAEIPVPAEKIQTNEISETVLGLPRVSAWHWSHWLLLVYCIGAAIVTILFLYKLLKFLQMHRNANPWQQNIYLSALAKPAHSFAGTIYLHPELPGKSELQPILQHEQVHVKQWHTLDLILFELLSILFWFNPISWLLAQESRLNNEMLADQVSSSSGSKTDYAILLLKYAYRNQQQLSYSFARLGIKSRIEGVLRKQSKSKARARFAIFLPVLALCFLIFACEDPMDMISADYLVEGKALKKVEAVYIDEYGDIPHKDGKIISSFEMDRAGNVIKSNKSLPQHNIKSDYALDNINLLLWSPPLTRGFIQHGFEYLSQYASAKENFRLEDKNKSKLRRLSGPWLPDSEINISVTYENGLPVVIEKHIKQEVLKIINYEKFQYDPDQKLLTYQRTYQKTYHRNKSIRMSPIPDAEKFMLEKVTTKTQTTHYFQFDEMDRLETIYREDGSLLEKIYYQNKSQLIDYYEVYNLKDELEITVKINYEFY